jgi:hypothetical protein
MRHSRNSKKFNTMNDAQRLEFMATADRVTVGMITQVFDHELKQFYVAKVRGIIVSDGDTYRFDTPHEASRFGHKILRNWQEKYYRLENTPNQREALDFFTETEPA